MLCFSNYFALIRTPDADFSSQTKFDLLATVWFRQKGPFHSLDLLYEIFNADQQDFEIHDKMLQFVFMRVLSACRTEKKIPKYRRLMQILTTKKHRFLLQVLFFPEHPNLRLNNRPR